MSFRTKHFDSWQAVDENCSFNQGGHDMCTWFQVFLGIWGQPQSSEKYCKCLHFLSWSCFGKAVFWEVFVQIHYYFVATNLWINYQKHRIGNSFMCFCHDEFTRNWIIISANRLIYYSLQGAYWFSREGNELYDIFVAMTSGTATVE